MLNKEFAMLAYKQLRGRLLKPFDFPVDDTEEEGLGPNTEEWQPLFQLTTTMSDLNHKPWLLEESSFRSLPPFWSVYYVSDIMQHFGRDN